MFLVMMPDSESLLDWSLGTNAFESGTGCLSQGVTRNVTLLETHRYYKPELCRFTHVTSNEQHIKDYY